MSERRRERNAGWIWAAVVGAAVVVLFLVIGLGSVLVLGGGIAGFVAGLLIFSRRKSRGEMIVSLSGVSREMYEGALKEGRAKLAALAALAKRVESAEVRLKIDAIGGIVERIFDDLRKDPKDIKPARKFLTYYLDATVTVLRKYVDLSQSGTTSAEVRSTLQRVESNLDLIRTAFERQLAKLLEDDLLDLDTEIALLEKTIKLEGLGEEENHES